MKKIIFAATVAVTLNVIANPFSGSVANAYEERTPNLCLATLVKDRYRLSGCEKIYETYASYTFEQMVHFARASTIMTSKGLMSYLLEIQQSLRDIPVEPQITIAVKAPKFRNCDTVTAEDVRLSKKLGGKYICSDGFHRDGTPVKSRMFGN